MAGNAKTEEEVTRNMVDQTPHLPSSSISALPPPSPARQRPKPPLRSRSQIDEILETARKRSIALQKSGEPLPMSISPKQSRLFEHDRSAPPDGTESSADEHTAIIRSESRRRNDYQSTGTSARSRNSLQSNPGGSRHELEGRQESALVSNGTATKELKTWWEKKVEKYGSIELENKGSVARDHLALERTFLAWLRTSLAFASIGIAVTQLFRLNTSISGGSPSGDDSYQHLRQLGKPLGATFLGISILVLFVGFHRYFAGQHWIIRGKFPASRGSVALIAAVAFALMVTSLIVVLVVEPSQFEKRR